MRKVALVLSCLLLSFAAPMLAQSAAKPSPLGIWRANLDGVPSVVLTLADDTGDLGGTVVFSSISGHTRRAISVEPHTLIHPRLDGNTLSFQIRRPNASLISFTVEFTGEAKARIHCLDCGKAPTADLTRDVQLGLLMSPIRK